MTVSDSQQAKPDRAVDKNRNAARDTTQDTTRDTTRDMTLNVEVAAAAGKVAKGIPLIDIRSPHEWLGGVASGAVKLSQDELPAALGRYAADTELLLICQTGQRSQRAAAALRKSGYRNVCNVAGGLDAWRKADLPLDRDPRLSDRQYERYARHLVMPEVGVDGQARLMNASVLLVGAGGLGSPAALYLAAAGVGRLGLIDDDIVERSNLQRQILHDEAQLNAAKVESGRTRLQNLNPDIAVTGYASRLTADNIDQYLPDYDVVLDGSDNLATRYLVNDACLKHRKPMVYGAVYRFQGQVSVFWPGRPSGRGPCYRCLFPEPPPPEAAPSCAAAGVLGVLPGVIGSLQATEVLKLVLDIGEPLVGRLLAFDALTGNFKTIRLRPDPDCYCHTDAVQQAYSEYSAHCGDRHR